MKLTLCFATALSLSFTSCSTFDPDYAEYKKQKEAQKAAEGTSNLWGNPGGESGAFIPNQDWDPLPGVTNPPPAPDPILPVVGLTPGPTPYPDLPPAPAPGAGISAPAGNTVPHIVTKGDSLWGLAKRYGTSVEAIQAANGLSGINIQTGRTLQIPSNN
jgi:nucleoid-associated protein YgaU